MVIPPKPANSESSDVEANGDEHGTKRAKISLKIKKPEAEEVAIETEKPEVETVVVKEVEVKKEGNVERALSKEVRDAFAKVVVACVSSHVTRAMLTDSMAANLPPPLNRILGLWLPPDFAQKQENTLGYVLRQDTLTWETLVVSANRLSELNIRTSCTYSQRTY